MILFWTGTYPPDTNAGAEGREGRQKCRDLGRTSWQLYLLSILPPTVLSETELQWVQLYPKVVKTARTTKQSIATIQGDGCVN